MRDLVAKIVPGKGQGSDICIVDFNIDLESGVCSVTLDGNGKADRSKACSYCYAAYLYKKDPDAYKAKKIRELEFKKIATKYPMHILRIGKNFDCGHKRTREQLYELLELCCKYNVRPIVTSKLLEYDRKVSDLVIRSRGIIHISLGRDQDERGAVDQGSTNRYRLSQALRYKRAGTPAQVRIVADCTMPMNDFHKKAVELMGGSKGVLLTPLHYTSKAHFESMRTDLTWQEVKDKGIFSYVHGDLRPNIFHSDWETVRERCGLISGRMNCNNCVRKIGFNKKEYKDKLVQLGWNN